MTAPPASAAHERVAVAVRMRPPLPNENRDPELEADETLQSVIIDQDRCFLYDRVYGPSADQAAIFDSSVQPLVDGLFRGFNACVFAYGQTGSGKTFTMLGEDGGKKSLDGIVPRVAEAVFQRIAVERTAFAHLAPGGVSQYQLRVSYVEVYNDDVRDLLRDGQPRVAVREREGNVFVAGAHEEVVPDTTALLRAVRRGSLRRATGRTDMNAHSSRSHAVFILALEHRYRSATEPNPRRFKVQTALFNLVDLAGSECNKRTHNTGLRFQESIAINTGLLALGNVIAALAGQTGAEFVPYRDSVLTRLLQSSLGGNSRTLMLACVSPAVADRAETQGTLRYAHSAKRVRNRPLVEVREVFEEKGPLEDDVCDPNPKFDRRTMWLDTKVGLIYARCLGRPEQELLLYVHGSGPDNSSAWWNELTHEVAARAEATCWASFYQVAIDCPGYGQSPGDRQAVRSAPATLLAAVLQALGKGQALALIGSSQGACSVFNAVLEMPSLCQYIAVRDPVGHDVFRYSAIAQPTLLIFELEDEGHPVRVGRWMRDALPRPHYFEFSSATHPYWHADNMARELLYMMAQHDRKADGPLGLLPALMKTATRLAGGLCAWVEARGREMPIKSLRSGLLEAPSLFLDAIGWSDASSVRSDPSRRPPPPAPARRPNTAAAAEEVLWRAAVCPETGRVYYVHRDTGDVSWTLPKGLPALAPPLAPVPPAEDLFHDMDAAPPPEPTAESAEQERKRLEVEDAETRCGYCTELLWDPVRLPSCRHPLCLPCAQRTCKYTGACPACNAAVPKPRSLSPDPDWAQRVLSAVAPEAWTARLTRHEALLEELRGSCRVVVEYGNQADHRGGGQFAVEAFLRIVEVDRGPKAALVVGKSTAIERVEFDINPDFPKAAVKVKEPPYTLSRCMASKFPCNMTVHWRDKARLRPLTLVYTIRPGLNSSAWTLRTALHPNGYSALRAPRPAGDHPARGGLAPTARAPATSARGQAARHARPGPRGLALVSSRDSEIIGLPSSRSPLHRLPNTANLFPFSRR